MDSFNIVNYSLRPSKSIQRQIVFDGVRALPINWDDEKAVYIGFGSIWFTDFVMAHKILGINDMISMEKSEIGYCRARFNSPYATVDVRSGSASEILPLLCDDEDVNKRPWVIWLDYDGAFDETLRSDIRLVIEKAPGNTVLLITFNGRDNRYGKPSERPIRLRQLFEDVVPDDLQRSHCKGADMQRTLADLATDFMKSIAAESARLGGFFPAFRVIYKDGTEMVTVGGVLPSPAAISRISEAVSRNAWKCRYCPDEPIVAPHLTIREAMALQSKLPNPQGLSRDIVQSLGFDLEEQQIAVYAKYYREYPAFAQIIA